MRKPSPCTTAWPLQRMIPLRWPPERLDWAKVIESLDRRATAISLALMEGRELTLLVARLKRSRSALQEDKAELGGLIAACLGSDILLEVQRSPGWRHTTQAVRERLACRAERRAG
jgi:hypothetical protein